MPAALGSAVQASSSPCGTPHQPVGGSIERYHRPKDSFNQFQPAKRQDLIGPGRQIKPIESDNRFH
jgi:hypothetical protein